MIFKVFALFLTKVRIVWQTFINSHLLAIINNHTYICMCMRVRIIYASTYVCL